MVLLICRVSILGCRRRSGNYRSSFHQKNIADDSLNPENIEEKRQLPWKSPASYSNNRRWHIKATVPSQNEDKALKKILLDSFVSGHLMIMMQVTIQFLHFTGSLDGSSASRRNHTSKNDFLKIFHKKKISFKKNVQCQQNTPGRLQMHRCVIIGANSVIFFFRVLVKRMF